MTDVLKEGDLVKVKVLAIDDRGKIKLSMRAVDQVTGEPLEVAPRPPAARRARATASGAATAAASAATAGSGGAASGE